MVIGITGNNKSGKIKISKYFSYKYSLRYIDADGILEKILEEDSYIAKLKQADWKNNYSLLLKIRNEIDERILKKISQFGVNENIVIDYSLLDNSSVFCSCDLIIKVISNDKLALNSSAEILRNYVVNGISDCCDESKYHLKINISDMSENWQERLTEFINYNIFNNTKVTVVVPVYNTEKYLSRCVNSITNQSYRNLEIILIDDGSTDCSLEVCNLLAKKDKRIKVIHQDNIGLSETRNKGIELAAGDYICFVDSDDFVEKGMIENLLKNAEKNNSDVSAVRAFIHLRNGKVENYSNDERQIISISEKHELISSYCDGIISIAAWDKLYKKSALNGIRFDKKVFKEDVDFILKLCLAQRSFVCDTKEYYHYVKRNEGSLTGDKFSERLFQLQEWGHQAYSNIKSLGKEYQDDAEKCLFNSLSHILKTYMRDLKKNKITGNDYKGEIQSVVNDIISLLLNAKNVKKFDDLDNVLSIINELLEKKIIDKNRMPVIEVPCVGILWNTLNEELMSEALKIIEQNSDIKECIYTDLRERYHEFINEIYFYNNEFEGIPYFKACALIDKYDSNTIVVLNLIIRVSNYIYYNGLKGYMFKEIAELKQFIRHSFKKKIVNYGYDTIFHLTVDEEEYEYTDKICKKYIKDYRGTSNGK